MAGKAEWVQSDSEPLPMTYFCVGVCDNWWFSDNRLYHKNVKIHLDGHILIFVLFGFGLEVDNVWQARQNGFTALVDQMCRSFIFLFLCWRL